MTKHQRWALKQVRNDKDHPLHRVGPAPQEQQYNPGLIMGVLKHSHGYMPAEQVWARSVPQQYRKPGRVVRSGSK